MLTAMLKAASTRGMKARKRSTRGSPEEGMIVDSLSSPARRSKKASESHHEWPLYLESPELAARNDSEAAPMRTATRQGSQKTSCWATSSPPLVTVTVYVSGFDKFGRAARTEAVNARKKERRTLVPANEAFPTP